MADGHITSLIEFKLWKKENDKQLVADIAKLNLEQKGINKWLLVLSFGGNRNQNRKYLTDRNPLLKFLRDGTISSKWYDFKEHQHKLINIDLFLFEL